ncbi:MAG: YeeE/YedE family protein [Casimicrobium sp.]
MHPYLVSLVGGLLIGVSVWLMFAGLGRVTGISSIAAAALTAPKESLWRYAFLLGLMGGGLLFVRMFGAVVTSVASPVWLIVAGLLVGFGTVLGGGCTSGHGVCGLGRRSPRSLIATLIFMVVGMATVAVIRALHGGAA